MSPDVRKYGIYVLYDVKWIWYYSNFSPKFYVLKFDLRYPQNFWTYNISIHQNNKCNAGSRSHPGLGHTTSHLCGQHNSWKCKQMYVYLDLNLNLNLNFHDWVYFKNNLPNKHWVFLRNEKRRTRKRNFVISMKKNPRWVIFKQSGKGYT